MNIFHRLLDLLKEQLPDLGQVLALDGKELHSYAGQKISHPLPEDATGNDCDGRRDRDADWGAKGRGKQRRWFGFLLRLVVDANYELPVAFKVTPASRAQQPQAQRLLDQLQDRPNPTQRNCLQLVTGNATRDLHL